jgi:hypothetical protein
MRVKDKISFDTSNLDMAVNFLFKYTNNTRKNLRILENSLEINDYTEDLKVF